MKFTGQIRVPEVDHPGVPASLVVEGTHLEVQLEGEALGRWSLYDVHAERLVSNVFQLELAGEELTFLADDPIDFAYTGVEQMAEAWARFKAMRFPRRLVAVSRSRRGVKPSRVGELRSTMEANLAARGGSASGVAARPAERPLPGVSVVESSANRIDVPPSTPETITTETPSPDRAVRDPEQDPNAELEEERRRLEEARRELERERRRLEEARAEARRLEEERLAALRAEEERLEEKRRAAEELLELERYEADRLERVRLEVMRLEEERRELVSRRAEEERREEERLAELRAEEERLDRLRIDAESRMSRNVQPGGHEDGGEVQGEPVKSSADHESIPASKNGAEAGGEVQDETVEAPSMRDAPASPATDDQDDGSVGNKTDEDDPVVVDLATFEKVRGGESNHLADTGVPATADEHDGEVDGVSREDASRPEPVMSAAPPSRSGGLVGAVRSAFTLGSRSHEHDFTEAPGGLGMVRYICRDCGYVSISVSE